MGESKRQLQVGEVIKRNFSIVLQNEGSYIYGDAMVSVTKAVVSPDLSQAKIYLSIYGTENKQAVLLEIENQLHGLKQSLVHRIKKHVRRIPSIAVYIDDTLDEMERLNKLFDSLK